MEQSRNLEGLRHAIILQLPAHSRWLVRETPVRWDFSRAAQPLQPIPEDDAAEWTEVLPADWRQILIFGEEDVADGGGASPLLGIHAQTAEVLGLDVERERSAVFLPNSSVPAFVETFLILDKALGPGGRWSSDLRDRLHTLDPGAFERSDWRLLVDYLDESAEDGA
jgi:hypothetical protein